MAQQTTTILHVEYGKFKEVQQLEIVTSQEATLNLVLGNWPSNFTLTCNKLKAHRSMISDLKMTWSHTTDKKAKMTISNHIDKENEVEEELAKQDKEWIKEATKDQMVIEKSIKLLEQVKGKT